MQYTWAPHVTFRSVLLVTWSPEQLCAAGRFRNSDIIEQLGIMAFRQPFTGRSLATGSVQLGCFFFEGISPSSEFLRKLGSSGVQAQIDVVHGKYGTTFFEFVCNSYIPPNVIPDIYGLGGKLGKPE